MKGNRKQSSRPKMPKWTQSQSAQDESFEFIKRVFRGWRPEPIQSNDIGLDIRFEIIESNGEATGADFSVQLKSTKSLKTYKGAVLYPCKVSTINYFLARP